MPLGKTKLVSSLDMCVSLHDKYSLNTSFSFKINLLQSTNAMARITFRSVSYLCAAFFEKPVFCLQSSEHCFCFVSTASIIFIIWTTKVFKLVDCQRVRLFSVLIVIYLC